MARPTCFTYHGGGTPCMTQLCGAAQGYPGEVAGSSRTDFAQCLRGMSPQSRKDFVTSHYSATGEVLLPGATRIVNGFAHLLHPKPPLRTDALTDVVMVELATAFTRHTHYRKGTDKGQTRLFEVQPAHAHLTTFHSSGAAKRRKRADGTPAAAGNVYRLLKHHQDHCDDHRFGAGLVILAPAVPETGSLYRVHHLRAYVAAELGVPRHHVDLYARKKMPAQPHSGMLNLAVALANTDHVAKHATPIASQACCTLFYEVVDRRRAPSGWATAPADALPTRHWKQLNQTSADTVDAAPNLTGRKFYTSEGRDVGIFTPLSIEDATAAPWRNLYVVVSNPPQATVLSRLATSDAAEADDILHVIFTFLDVRDILNLSRAHPRFAEAADAARRSRKDYYFGIDPHGMLKPDSVTLRPGDRAGVKEFLGAARFFPDTWWANLTHLTFGATGPGILGRIVNLLSGLRVLDVVRHLPHSAGHGHDEHDINLFRVADGTTTAPGYACRGSDTIDSGAMKAKLNMLAFNLEQDVIDLFERDCHWHPRRAGVPVARPLMKSATIASQSLSTLRCRSADGTAACIPVNRRLSEMGGAVRGDTETPPPADVLHIFCPNLSDVELNFGRVSCPTELNSVNKHEASHAMHQLSRVSRAVLTELPCCPSTMLARLTLVTRLSLSPKDKTKSRPLNTSFLHAMVHLKDLTIEHYIICGMHLPDDCTIRFVDCAATVYPSIDTTNVHAIGAHGIRDQLVRTADDHVFGYAPWTTGPRQTARVQHLGGFGVFQHPHGATVVPPDALSEEDLRLAHFAINGTLRHGYMRVCFTRPGMRASSTHIKFDPLHAFKTGHGHATVSTLTDTPPAWAPVHTQDPYSNDVVYSCPQLPAP